jgi:hypothetical protein
MEVNSKFLLRPGILIRIALSLHIFVVLADSAGLGRNGGE